MLMGVEAVMMAAVDEVMPACPLARKPLAMSTMKTASQTAWRMSAQRGRRQRPVRSSSRDSSSPPQSMRRPQRVKGPQACMHSLRQM